MLGFSTAAENPSFTAKRFALFIDIHIKMGYNLHDIDLGGFLSDMDSAKYTIGIDFGTLSARAVMVRLCDGCEMGTASFAYPHGVMDEYLDTPRGKLRLGQDFALQNADDYITAISQVIPKLLKECGVSACDVVGLGIDFTTCTLLPTDENGVPMSSKNEFSCDPHAYVKLWKHHSAEEYAVKLTETAERRGERWLGNYGGHVSSEWTIPKIWETLDKSPEIYNKCRYFFDAGDWMVYRLTGRVTRNSCMAGYKALYADGAYPSHEFLHELDSRLEYVYEERLDGEICPIGSLAGRINEYGAGLTGLCVGTAVSAAVPDAHVASPALKITKPGQMFIIMGTSGCHMLISDKNTVVPGICGIVRDGLIPGYYGYEAGQSCFGDHFSWLAENLSPADYKAEASERGISLIQLLTEKAEAKKPGESGILALDWWNGNRCILTDYDLSGMFVGMNLSTCAEDLFRALVEAAAFGTRMIIENYREHGVAVNECCAAGGIAVKNPFLMQVFADVTGLELSLTASKETPSLGSAIFASVAAGYYENLGKAAEVMGKLSDKIYKPIPENSAVYDKLYAEYKLLHDYFGRGENNVMKRLRKIRAEQL